MKKLTRGQLKDLHGFNRSREQALRNGEKGFCRTTKTLVTCCVNCGQYTHTKLSKLQDK